jgi:Protein of unknown function (DUF2442)
MIKIVKGEHIKDYKIRLTFSNAAYGEYDFSRLLKKETALTKPLSDQAAFKAFYLELGALCWKSGLELSPAALYEELKVEGKLTHTPQAA